MEEFSVGDAGKKLDSLIDEVNSSEDPLIICNKKGKKAVLISLDDFEWLHQTLARFANFADDEELQQIFTDSECDENSGEELEPLKTDFIQVYQLKVALNGIRPPVWRRIQVPANYTFWDLHVALQDSMGWFDCHLHEFQVQNPSSGLEERIGTPAEEDSELLGVVHPGWKRYISDYFSLENPKAQYMYDFGDDWQHTLTVEKILSREKGKQYPLCMKGKRACPPEDCGGVSGYEDLLKIIADPNHEDYDEWMERLEEDFDPEDFDSKSVGFDDPRARWDLAFA